MESEDTAYVWVYRYRYWDPDKNDTVLSTEMATHDAIRNGLGIPAHETALRVRATDVDHYGRYRSARVETESKR